MSAKKAAEAVVIEEATELAISVMQPGLAIEANFAALAAGLERLIAKYRDLQVTEAYLPQAKKDRAYLNGLKKDIDQVRLRVKREYNAPVVEFENNVKALAVPLDEVVSAIDAQVKAFEERERADKRAEFVRHYTDFAPILADVVPFERIEDPAWMLKACGITKAFEDIEARVERIAADDATLDSLNLSHPIEAKAEYFATLDIGRAIARSKALDEAEERVRKLEADKAEFDAFQAQQVPKPEPHAFVPASLQEPAPAPEPEPEPVTSWTLRFDCTRSDLDGVLAYLKSVGIQGVASR